MLSLHCLAGMAKWAATARAPARRRARAARSARRSRATDSRRPFVLQCRANTEDAATLGDLERLTLLAVLGLEEAYGLAVQRALAAAGRELAPGGVYTTLDRLERKGFLASRWGEPTPERGGRAKRIYRVTASGRSALAAAEKTASRLRAALAPRGARG